MCCSDFHHFHIVASNTKVRLQCCSITLASLCGLLALNLPIVCVLWRINLDVCVNLLVSISIRFARRSDQQQHDEPAGCSAGSGGADDLKMDVKMCSLPVIELEQNNTLVTAESEGSSKSLPNCTLGVCNLKQQQQSFSQLTSFVSCQTHQPPVSVTFSISLLADQRDLISSH